MSNVSKIPTNEIYIREKRPVTRHITHIHIYTYIYPIHVCIQATIAELQVQLQTVLSHAENDRNNGFVRPHARELEHHSEAAKEQDSQRASAREDARAEVAHDIALLHKGMCNININICSNFKINICSGYSQKSARCYIFYFK